MRSLKYLSAVLPLQFLGAYASKGNGADTTVVVTTTRTVTICPISDIFQCTPDVPTIRPTTVSTTSRGASSSLTSTISGSVSSSLASTTTRYGNGTTTSHSGNFTTTSYISTTTPIGGGNGTTTTPIGGGNGTTTTTSTTCAQNGTTTATGIPQPLCNKAGQRSQWCGKDIDSDTDKSYETRKTVEYTLRISKGSVDFDGSGKKEAFLINGKTPGEPIVANWGDMVQVTVINELPDNATTIHWHGIRQYGTNDQDGVPGVTECGIAPGSSRTYKWLASTYGTGWYHSHALSQYGGGLRGPIIIHGPATADYDLDMGHVMVDDMFSDTIFNMAYNIARVRGAFPAAVNTLVNGKQKSPNGATGEAFKWVVKEGKKHLFRIINSSAMSPYAIHFDNHKMKVISADFTPIVPYETETLFIQGGQRYNVIVEANQPKGSYYVRAIAQTGCGIASLNDGLGTSNAIIEYEGSCSTPASGNFTLVTAGFCKDEVNLQPYQSKTAGSQADFDASVKLIPGGNAAAQNFANFGAVNRWFFGGVTDLSQNNVNLTGTKGINVTFNQPTLKTMATVPDLSFNSSIYSNAVVLNQVNEWVYFVIQNNFQTSHPMHLHGHDFSVLGQGQGVFTSGMVGQLNFVNPIRRDTALLFGIGRPGAFTSGWTVIGFKTDNPGAWVMHCHIMFHAEGGMGLQYIERPSEINASKYYNSAGFQQECAAYDAYESAGGEQKSPYEAGIKRHLEDHKFHGYGHSHVVRNTL